MVAETLPETALVIRQKFVDEFNYDEGPRTLRSILDEVERIILGMPRITKMSSFTSTLAEELQSEGFAVRQKVGVLAIAKAKMKRSKIPIVCSKNRFHIALGICDKEVSIDATNLLSANSTSTRFHAKLLLLVNPSELARTTKMGAPNWANRVVLCNQPKNPLKTHRQDAETSAGGREGSREGLGGSVGRKGPGHGLEVRSLRFAPSTERSSNALRATRASKVLKPGIALKLDWERIDKYGNPTVSFDPGHPLHGKIAKVLLDEEANPKLREIVLEKLITETSRIYTRYRRDEAKSRGALGIKMAPGPKQHKQLEQIAIGCINLGITPRQVLEYWHSRVKDFTHGNLTVPGLGFLSSYVNLDQVACSGIGTIKTAPTELKTAADRNPFSDLSRFDVRLRGCLERGGFDTTAFNDRYLLSVQHNAVSIAKGHDIFVGDGKFGKMIRHAAEHLYSKTS